jgi:thiol-disulfide isomerase/thioredoxin
MKKTVIKFWAGFCGPCTMYAPTFERAMNQLQSDEIDFIEIDAQNDPNELVKKYGVTSIPLTLILDENHQELRRKAGGMRLEDLKSFILE